MEGALNKHEAEVSELKEVQKTQEVQKDKLDISEPTENYLLSEFKSFSDSFKEETDNSTKSDSFDDEENDSLLIESDSEPQTQIGNDIDKDTLSQGIALLFCYIAPIVVCYGYEYFAKKVVSNEARKSIEFTKREQSDISDALERTLEYYGRIKSDNPLTTLVLLVFGILASKIFILSTMEKEVKAEASNSYQEYKEKDTTSDVVLRKVKPKATTAKRVIKCKKCGGTGHNSATCKK